MGGDMSIVLDGSVGISSIGTLTGVTSISSAAADTPVILQDSSSNSNTCRAWVNFNGTSTVAIRADFNVTSITDNGTGDYTVNFTNAMPDVNYLLSGSALNATTFSNYGRTISIEQNGATSNYLTTSCRISSILTSTIARNDCEIVNVAIFR
jgi:hypothetical protein